MVTLLRRVNAALDNAGMHITRVTGTMWMALAFALLALTSLPAALSSGDPIIIVSWIAQTFLQLVLLSIIMVGQNAQAAKVEARDIETHNTVMADSAEKHAASAEERAEMTEMLTDLRELVKEALK